MIRPGKYINKRQWDDHSPVETLLNEEKVLYTMSMMVQVSQIKLKIDLYDENSEMQEALQDKADENVESLPYNKDNKEVVEGIEDTDLPEDENEATKAETDSQR